MCTYFLPPHLNIVSSLVPVTGSKFASFDSKQLTWFDAHAHTVGVNLSACATAAFT